MKKIDEQILKDGSSQVALFALEMDSFKFPKTRRFQEVSYSSEDDNLAVLVEHLNSEELLSGESRLAVFNVKNRDQWMTCWQRWSSFQDIKIKSDSNNKGQIEFTVKRNHRDISFKEIHDLPFLKQDLIHWEEVEIPLKLESTSTMNSVSFDSTRIQITEEPGPLPSEGLWSDIERIIIIRTVGPNDSQTHIDLFGSQKLTVTFPCQGATKFIEELMKRFQVNRENIDRTIRSKTSQQELLWTKNSSIAFLDEAITSFQSRDFENGFTINGQNIPWDITILELEKHPLFEFSKSNGSKIIQSKHPVQIAKLTLPRLYYFASSQSEDFACIKNWNFEFLGFSPALSDSRLEELLLPLMLDSSSWIKQSPFECLIFNEKIGISLDHLTGIWRGHFSLSHSFYWSIMRKKCPDTIKLKISDVLKIPLSATRIEVGQSNGMKTFPSPEKLYQDPLCFWKDSSQGLEGLTVNVESINWSAGHLKNLTCETFHQDGDRGDTITYYILEITLTKNRKLTLELSKFINENECRNVLDWLRKK